jgi:Putative zinc-finger/Fervidolysin N-terminal prodomain
MSGQILKFPDPHQTADALLPWFVNGTLEGEELALVQRHLGECARCRQELESLQRFAAAYVGSELEPDPDLTLGRLHRELRATRARNWRTGDGRWLARLAPALLAVQMGVILVLGGLLLAPLREAPGYRTLAADPAARPVAQLVVMFAPGTSEAELRRILRHAGARIADGPTVADAYVLEVAAGRQAAALAALRGEQAVVMAERLDAGGGR